MVKEMALRRRVYVALGLVLGITALWYFLFGPRLAAHPQANADGVDPQMFFSIRLVAMVILLVFMVISRISGRMLREPLYLVAIPMLMHDFMVLNGAIYYLETYKGFQAVSILMLACVGVDLFSGIMAVTAVNKLAKRPL